MITIKIKDQKLNSKNKSGFAPLVLIIVIGIVLAAGGLGLGLAWKAGLFGKPGGGPKDGTTTNGTQPTPPPQPPPSDGEKNGNGEEEPPPLPEPGIPADWKVYTNSTYGYSVGYPGDWGYHIGNDGDYTIPEDAANFSSPGPFGGRDIVLAVEDSGGRSAKGFGEELIRRYTLSSPVIYEGEIILGGLVGFSAAYLQEPFEASPALKFFYSVVVRGGKAYYFSTVLGVDEQTGEVLKTEAFDFKERQRIYNLMLSSFRFLPL